MIIFRGIWYIFNIFGLKKLWNFLIFVNWTGDAFYVLKQNSFAHHFQCGLFALPLKTSHSNSLTPGAFPYSKSDWGAFGWSCCARPARGRKKKTPLSYSWLNIQQKIKEKKIFFYILSSFSTIDMDPCVLIIEQERMQSECGRLSKYARLRRRGSALCGDTDRCCPGLCIPRRVAAFQRRTVTAPDCGSRSPSAGWSPWAGSTEGDRQAGAR